MNVFSCQFRGARVCVTYEGGLGDEVIWIANVTLDGRVQSVDGAVAVQSMHAQAEITRAVFRALEWASRAGRR